MFNAKTVVASLASSTPHNCRPTHQKHAQRILSLALVFCCAYSLMACSQLGFNRVKPGPITPLPTTHIKNTQQFDQDAMYSLMVAEVALVRERYELGLANYVNQARLTQDVNITARATQIARILNKHEESLELAEQWHTLDPGNREPRLILISEYIHAERFKDAFAHAKLLLQAGSSAGFEDIAIEAVQKDAPDIKFLTQTFEDLLSTYPNNTELLIGSSIMQQAADQLGPALQHVTLARTLDPENTRAIYQQFRILQKLKRDAEALETYRALVDLQPENFRVRNQYAHMLIRADMSAALAQYSILNSQAPQNNDVLLNLALIQLDQGAHEQARGNFETLVVRQQHESLAHYGLAEIANSKQDTSSALNHYVQVNSGTRYVDAASKAADIIAKQNSFEDALVFIASRREGAVGEDREQLYLIEAETLNTASMYIRAEAMFNMAIDEFPQSLQLLYSRAMFLAQQNDITAAEYDFKAVLEQTPDSAATLNALGYTLLSDDKRVRDAEVYIRKAYALMPQDPATIDSLGWLEFKLGNYSKARKLLETALDQLMDDEIAAHLGEVLWQMGKPKLALKVWLRGLEHAPKSSIIHTTLERLGADVK